MIYILLTLLAISVVMIVKKVTKIAIITILAAMILLSAVNILGIRTNINVYNMYNHKLELNIRHKELINGNSFTKFTSTLSFDKLSKKVNTQYNKSFVNNGRIYIVKDNTIYSISKQEEVRNWGVKCYTYVINADYIPVKSNGTTHYVEFPQDMLKTPYEKTNGPREIIGTFSDLAKFYKDFNNVVINNNQIAINKDAEKDIITVNNNKVTIEVK